MDEKELLEKVGKNLTKLEGRKIAIAVSGGADSLALLLIINKIAKFQIVALTVDHGLRKESEIETQKVAKLASKYSIEHHVLRWESENVHSNIQSKARDARYELMEQFCQKNNIKDLLVAHNLEDQAETLLIRIMRGSGVDGLSCMSQNTKRGNINIIRPLLEVSKDELKKFLNNQRQEWIEDPSNKNDKFLRVNIRNFINNSSEPKLLVQRLANTAINMQRSRSYIESKIEEDLKNTVTFRPEGYCLINKEHFKNLHEEAAFRILSKTIKNVSGQYYKARFEKITNLYEKILNDKISKSVTLNGCEIYDSKSDESKIIISRELSAIEERKDLKVGDKVVWDNRFLCELKNLTESDNFYIDRLTDSGLKYLNEDYNSLRNIDLPKKIIYSLPALKKGNGEVISIPHLNINSDKYNFTAIFVNNSITFK